MPVCFQTPGHRRILSALQVKPPTRTPTSGKRTNSRRDLQRSEAPSRGGEEETDGYQCLDHRRPQGSPPGTTDGPGPGPGARGGRRGRERGGGAASGNASRAGRGPDGPGHAGDGRRAGHQGHPGRAARHAGGGPNQRPRGCLGDPSGAGGRHRLSPQEHRIRRVVPGHQSGCRGPGAARPRGGGAPDARGERPGEIRGPHRTRDRGLEARGAGHGQQADRAQPLHRGEDRQDPRLEHLAEAGRQQPHPGGAARRAHRPHLARRPGRGSVITPEEGRPAQRATPPARDFAPYLVEASEVLASSLDYQETLKNLAHLVVPDLADWCAIDMLEEDGSINQLVLTHEDPDKVALAQELRRRFPPDPDASQGVPHVLRSGKAEFYPEVTGEMLVATARDAEHLRIMREVGFASVMIVPLVARGRTLGAITLVWAGSGRRHEPEDLALAEDLARRAALAVDNARLYREAQREITEREKAEEEARGSWSQLEAILQGIADGVTAQDLTGRLVYANEV